MTRCRVLFVLILTAACGTTPEPRPEDWTVHVTGRLDTRPLAPARALPIKELPPEEDRLAGADLYHRITRPGHVPGPFFQNKDWPPRAGRDKRTDGREGGGGPGAG